MTYWIYNMGMPIRVDSNRLLDKRRVEPLSALARPEALKATKKDSEKDIPTHKQVDNYQHQDTLEKVLYAGQIMTKAVHTLPSDMRFTDAWHRFSQQRFRHFPVVDKQQQLVGIVADRDMLLHAASTNAKDVTIDKIMKSPILTAAPDAAIRELCQIMINQHIGALPITQENVGLVGIVTRSDILRAMINHAPMELWA